MTPRKAETYRGFIRNIDRNKKANSLKAMRLILKSLGLNISRSNLDYYLARKSVGGLGLKTTKDIIEYMQTTVRGALIMSDISHLSRKHTRKILENPTAPIRLSY